MVTSAQNFNRKFRRLKYGSCHSVLASPTLDFTASYSHPQSSTPSPLTPSQEWVIRRTKLSQLIKTIFRVTEEAPLLPICRSPARHPNDLLE